MLNPLFYQKFFKLESLDIGKLLYGSNQPGHLWNWDPKISWKNSQIKKRNYWKWFLIQTEDCKSKLVPKEN